MAKDILLVEVELRARVSASQIKKIIPNKTRVSYEEDTYFSFPADKKRLWIARIRNKDGILFLTLKSSKKFGEGAWNEVELKINQDQARQLSDFFISNEFIVDVKIKKQRVTFSQGELSINIDKILGLGSFIEVESLASEKDVEISREKIVQYMDSLGIKKKAIITKGYVKLMKEKKHGKKT